MDAYVFARTASEAAVDTLLGAVTGGGPVRVVCPLRGDRELYVAVTAADAQALADAVADVVATEGLTGTDVYTAGSGDSAAFPTHVAVLAHIGFTVLDVAEGSVTVIVTAASQIPGIAGVAGVDDDSAVLVEATGKTFDAVRDALERAEDLTGSATFMGAGQTGDGAGFRAS